MTNFCYHCLTRERAHAPLAAEEAKITFNLSGVSLCPRHFTAWQAEHETRQRNRQRERTWYGLADYAEFQEAMERVWETQDRKGGYDHQNATSG